jgi:mRNA interferase MazF
MSTITLTLPEKLLKTSSKLAESLRLSRAATEPGKTRPVLVVQAQALLEAEHPSTLVIPLTTHMADDAEPLRIRVPAAGRLRKGSDLLVDQLRAIDNRRLTDGPLTRLSAVQLQKEAHALREVLHLI